MREEQAFPPSSFCIAVISSAFSVKSNTSKFCSILSLWVDFVISTTLFGGNEAWGVLMAATIGVPLYACGGGTIPLLQMWLSDRMSLGSAAAFMITGPATKITNLGAVKIVLGIKRFLLYIAFTALFACLTGLAVNLIIS